MDLPKGRANLLFGQLDHKKCIENEENRAEPRGSVGWGVVQVRVQYLSMWMRHYIKKLTLNGFYLNYKLLQRTNSAECINKLLYFFIDKFVKM